MIDTEMLQLYEQLIPFWSEVCGPGTEICLYDLSDPDHALTAVCNPRPGREPGDALPAPLKELLQSGFPGPQPWITLPPEQGYRADLCCRVFPIGGTQSPVGLLCVTKDLGSARELTGALRTVLDQFALEPPCREPVPAEETSLNAMMQERISTIIMAYGIPPARMSVQEKVEVVHQLRDSGLMNMKGAVSEIASQLTVSVPTIYRYLNKSIRK